MSINLNRLEEKAAVFFLTSIFVLPRSYLFIKLFFLTVYIVFCFVRVFKEKKIHINRNIFFFYGVIILIGTVWSFIGAINGSRAIDISDNFRLWGIWSICYALVIILFLQRDNILFFHRSIVISGVLISIINIIGLCNNFYGLGIIPESILEEIDLKIGIHDGYVQITTENITSLFFIVPYFIALQFRENSGSLNTTNAKISFFLCFLLAAFSGRRALWLSIIITPFIILGMSFCLGTINRLKSRLKKFTYVLFCFGIIAFFFITTSDSLDIPTLTHLKEAFSAEDERSIQKGFLINAFVDNPFFGSGFGGNAGYTRNADRPWLYELTYHQLLFNFGILGTFCIIFILGCFFYMIIRNLKTNKVNDLIPFCILIGITSFAIGAYSNPYFQSFDFLIYISMIPYLASLKLSKNNSDN